MPTHDSNRIVFVIGAGASAPYGLQCSGEFKTSIVELTRFVASERGDIGAPRGHAMLSGFSSSALLDFAERLDLSQLASIDDFLEANRDLAPMGRLLIARQILDQEARAQPNFRSTARDNWLEHLGRLMPDLVDRLEDGSVAFVTFNYDRIVEYFLFLLLHRGRNMAEERCHDIIERLRIVHVHGHLGELRRFPIGSDGSGILTVELQNMCSGLRFAFEEDLDRVSSVTTAQHVIDSSRHLCFIGFGFHQANLDRLEMWKGNKPGTLGKLLDHDRTVARAPKQVYGTTLGLGRRRLHELQTYFSERGVQSDLSECTSAESSTFRISKFLSELPFLKS